LSGESWTELTIGLAALVLMALAATIEAAVGSVSRQRLREAGEQQGRHRTVQGLLDPRRTLVASLLLVQAVAIAVAASYLTTVIGREVGSFDHILTVVSVALAYLLFGRALPQALSLRRPDETASVLVRFADLVTMLVRPLSTLSDGLARLIARALPGPLPAQIPVGTGEELRAIAMDADGGMIEAEEREMIDGILRLEEMTAREIMVPRVDMVAIERGASLDVIIATITEAGHSRIPVYEESIDQILGVLYAKDLLPFVVGTTERPPLLDLIRPAHVVPESKRADALLTELRRDHIHIAIVADEYGGTAGMLTIEDILEEIVGEIQDEHDSEQPLFERIGERQLLVDGRLPIEDIEEATGLTFAEADYGTMGGFVHRHLGRLPREGESFDAEGVHIDVLKVEGNRVRLLRVETPVATHGAVVGPVPRNVTPDGLPPRPDRDDRVP
jgi:putative hemolysin